MRRHFVPCNHLQYAGDDIHQGHGCPHGYEIAMEGNDGKDDGGDRKPG